MGHLEGEWSLQIRELLIVEAAASERTRRHRPRDGVEFIGESALESHHDVAPIPHIVGQTTQEFVTGHIKRRNHDQAILRKIRGFGKTKNRRLHSRDRGRHTSDA